MTSIQFEPVALENFSKVLGTTSTEVSSVALGGKILSCSDEWFAPATDLLKVGPAESMKGQFGPTGALFDGWETRRHNSTYDWVIMRLGPAAGGSIVGFDVDTANFNGNEAPEVEIFGLRLTPEEEKAGKAVREDDAQWAPLLPRTPCNPSSRHLFALSSSASSSNLTYTHIKLHMIPDGGIARFRVYGTVPAPPLGLGESEFATSSEGVVQQNALDLAHVLNGGRVVFTSDQHFGVGPNVLLPGRGKDMGDGWETKRSRTPGHTDHLIIKLGEEGLLNYAEIDTNHFLGNFPESVELYATLHDGLLPPEDAQWVRILNRSKTGPGKQHFFPLQNVQEKPFSHVKVIMHPDGGIKRVRIIGRRSGPLSHFSGVLPSVPLPEKILPGVPSTALNGLKTAVGNFFTSSTFSSSSTPRGFLGSRNVSPSTAPINLKITPLTLSSFAGYGEVISQTPEKSFKVVNQGTAQKYEHLSNLVSYYPNSANAKSTIHVYRCKGVEETKLDVKVLERHQFTKQAFLPLSSSGQEAGQNGYVVIVAKNGQDDLPDLTTLAVFRATSEQGVAYGAGVWHHPMIALGSQATDFAVVVYESATEPMLNCDEVFYDREVASIHL
ncbi:hypothetical protein CBS101457_002340 [Exobasidium rhododendri]|nr:hypothetical protein CBS101457_002340 [Exobasidium rhododendri]